MPQPSSQPNWSAAGCKSSGRPTGFLLGLLIIHRLISWWAGDTAELDRELIRSSQPTLQQSSKTKLPSQRKAGRLEKKLKLAAVHPTRRARTPKKVQAAARHEGSAGPLFDCEGWAISFSGSQRWIAGLFGISLLFRCCEFQWWWHPQGTVSTASHFPWTASSQSQPTSETEGGQT